MPLPAQEIRFLAHSERIVSFVVQRPLRQQASMVALKHAGCQCCTHVLNLTVGNATVGRFSVPGYDDDSEPFIEYGQDAGPLLTQLPPPQELPELGSMVVPYNQDCDLILEPAPQENKPSVLAQLLSGEEVN